MILGTVPDADALTKKAVNGAVDEAYDLVDISNREARFALILMGSLNAFLLLAASRTDVMSGLTPVQRMWLAPLLGIYALIAMYFLLEAIEALRPGRFRPALGTWAAGSSDFPQGVRYFEDVAQRDIPSHWQAWRHVHLEQLNAELAIQLHSLCRKNQVKRNSLRRLYAGLRVMTLLIAALIGLFTYGMLF
jgi:hypothetical protein